MNKTTIIVSVIGLIAVIAAASLFARAKVQAAQADADAKIRAASAKGSGMSGGFWSQGGAAVGKLVDTIF